MNMIERVARAIVGTTGEFNFDTDVEMRETFLREARNAIEALRVPTPEMVEVGIYARDNNATIGDNMAASFAAMIDAALKD